MVNEDLKRFSTLLVIRKFKSKPYNTNNRDGYNNKD
jgi:hypothetical protein